MANRKIENETRSAVLALNLTPTLLKNITKMAEAHSMSRTEFTIQALRYYLEAQAAHSNWGVDNDYFPVPLNARATHAAS